MSTYKNLRIDIDEKPVESMRALFFPAIPEALFIERISRHRHLRQSE
jgi:hypothetical protein